MTEERNLVFGNYNEVVVSGQLRALMSWGA